MSAASRIEISSMAESPIVRANAEQMSVEPVCKLLHFCIRPANKQNVDDDNHSLQKRLKRFQFLVTGKIHSRKNA